ncbi:hypothetical protein AVEN_217009-1 [Araneus ventricosus]|uniref:Uncharacterized protein n=1 Tax=Araneus ventricosus TaxID=182803 RepID=A0A4Y2AS38_ARAVE|nr:hypothetical protein AVEN_32922-1 [Araneus ventricosus]GBL82485.1 hypothetical protein AVEN_36900-1 [Araneus ventricosus]GBL82565.1 hypothetical protein AVEN_159818-1 [Araneus ventricosus]GBL82610.1 hypothetical protein AVEN_217009-1 [Araneus ventricosus]
MPPHASVPGAISENYVSLYCTLVCESSKSRIKNLRIVCQGYWHVAAELVITKALLSNSNSHCVDEMRLIGDGGAQIIPNFIKNSRAIGVYLM